MGAKPQKIFLKNIMQSIWKFLIASDTKYIQGDSFLGYNSTLETIKIGTFQFLSFQLKILDQV